MAIDLDKKAKMCYNPKLYRVVFFWNGALRTKRKGFRMNRSNEDLKALANIVADLNTEAGESVRDMMTVITHHLFGSAVADLMDQSTSPSIDGAILSELRDRLRTVGLAPETEDLSDEDLISLATLTLDRFTEGR